MVKIAITGATGRMGRALIPAICAGEKMELVGAFVRPQSPALGQECVPGVFIEEASIEGLRSADVLIDFSLPEATMSVSQACIATGTAHVIGTTGFSDTQSQELTRAASKIPVLQAGNMSLGINLLENLVEKVAAALGEDFDIEIVETHHRFKRDAPSGTAQMLGAAAATGRKSHLEALAEYARHGDTGIRESGKIGFHAIRGGDVIGEHDVIFAAAGERIVLRHIATSRDIFVRGALQAALWIKGKSPGQYTLSDVLSG